MHGACPYLHCKKSCHHSEKFVNDFLEGTKKNRGQFYIKNQDRNPPDSGKMPAGSITIQTAWALLETSVVHAFRVIVTRFSNMFQHHPNLELCIYRICGIRYLFT